MTNITFTSIRRGMGLLIPFSLLILFITGCASQQEIRAKESLERASSAYAQARANPNVETYAKDQVAEAGRMIQAARDTNSSKNKEQLSYLAEKKTQTAVTISEGKVIEKEIETLSREEGDVLMRKRLLEAQLAQKEAQQSKLEAAKDAAGAEKARKEAAAQAQESEKARAEAEAKAQEAEQSKLQAEAKAREAEQSKLEAEKSRKEAEAKAREAEQTKAEVEQLLKDLSELQGKQTDRGIVLTMGDVLFAFGKADLASGAVRNVDKLAEFLKKHPERNVLIEGHTDSVGSDEFNLALSQKRADAVKEVLTAKGISPDRMATKGYGKQFPVAGNDTESGRQLNRRVEVVILNEGVKPEAVLR
jgi:outer membrane protein OmpA-like peptidoglycan-associated protein